MSYTASPRIDFELKQSELPPGCTAPLRAPADGRLVLNGKVILLRLVRLRAGEFVLYARWDERNALVLRKSAPQIWKHKPSPQKLRAIAGHFERDSSWKFASVHRVNSSPTGKTIVALNRNLHPITPYPNDCALTDDLKNPAPFEADFDAQKSEAINIMSALEMPGSYAEFLWHWMRATPKEREKIWQLKLEERAQLKHLMTIILYCLPELWAQPHEFRLQYNYSNWADNWYYREDCHAVKNVPLSDSAARWLASWQSYMSAHFHPTYVMQIQPFISHEIYDGVPYSSPLVQTPTAHEQLEARLHLRDWLQQNAPEMLNELSPA